MEAIPVRYSGSETDPAKIQAQIVAGHVARLGDGHETTFSVEQYGFLRDRSSELYRYYRWLVFCYRSGVEMTRLPEIEAHYLNNYIRPAPLGYLDLSDGDKNELLGMLGQNNSSKESIRDLRKWCLDRSHSMAAVAFVVYSYLVQVMQVPHDPTCFSKIKSTLYVLNDIFFNAKSAVWRGPYTTALTAAEETSPVDVIAPIFDYLPTIVFYSLGMALYPDQRQSIVGLVNIWLSRDFFAPHMREILEATLSASSPPPPPSCPTIFPVLMTTHDLQLFQKPKGPAPPACSSETSSSAPAPDMDTVHAPTPYSAPSSSSATETGGADAYLSPTAAIDPLLIPVGALANLVKGYLRCGGEPYTTIDPLHSPISVVAHVEPGRLNARLTDFYRKLETSLPPPPPPPPPNAAATRF